MPSDPRPLPPGVKFQGNNGVVNNLQYYTGLQVRNMLTPILFHTGALTVPEDEVGTAFNLTTDFVPFTGWQVEVPGLGVTYPSASDGQIQIDNAGRFQMSHRMELDVGSSVTVSMEFFASVAGGGFVDQQTGALVKFNPSVSNGVVVAAHFFDIIEAALPVIFEPRFRVTSGSVTAQVLGAELEVLGVEDFRVTATSLIT